MYSMTMFKMTTIMKDVVVDGTYDYDHKIDSW
jgi:hypothetical protein